MTLEWKPGQWVVNRETGHEGRIADHGEDPAPDGRHVMVNWLDPDGTPHFAVESRHAVRLVEANTPAEVARLRRLEEAAITAAIADMDGSPPQVQHATLLHLFHLALQDEAADIAARCPLCLPEEPDAT
jgi:hypothetical protein